MILFASIPNARRYDAGRQKKNIISNRFSLRQFCPSVASVVSVVLFQPFFHVLSGYFYVSLNITGIL